MGEKKQQAEADEEQAEADEQTTPQDKKTRPVPPEKKPAPTAAPGRAELPADALAGISRRVSALERAPAVTLPWWAVMLLAVVAGGLVLTVAALAARFARDWRK